VFLGPPSNDAIFLKEHCPMSGVRSGLTDDERTDWNKHEAAAMWRAAVDQLRSDPLAKLPEV